MIKNLPVYQSFKNLSDLFEIEGFQIRLVGGCVRDILLNTIPKDYDLATNATPEQMIGFLEKSNWNVYETGLEHGTITVSNRKDKFEITTLRIDSNCDGRFANVKFTDDWELDSKRRDFTINSIYMDVYGNLYDYNKGIKDLKSKTIRFVGDYKQRIQEDHLRILRLFRFISKYEDSNFLSEELSYCFRNINLLNNISVERVWDEYKKGFNQRFHMLLLNSNFYQKVFQIQHSQYYINQDCLSDPVLSIGEYVDNLEQFCNHIKCSNEEKLRIQSIKYFKGLNIQSKEDLIDLIQDGHNGQDVKVYFSKRSDLDVNFIDSYNRIDFPLRGQDLLDLGMKEGYNVGVELNKLKNVWKQSKYVLTRNQLLGIIVL